MPFGIKHSQNGFCGFLRRFPRLADDVIASAVKEAAGLTAFDPSAGFIANQRQRTCAEEAKVFVHEAYTALISGVTLDAVGIMCENALNRLYELSGENAGEEIIDSVFSRFCVGK